ncbi:hypothetical protein [Roseisolibacter agri]|uniref:Uncharacterized protein n=1 Tax=Roseisolibacter agri TaxID=2014610 RepID=A0AA37QG03_9BACT|nr:hypothetical protein [Roseisolibacter agri]GLC25088.1 hypothetical protein rosag_16010 [Roseisolibacter agri]
MKRRVKGHAKGRDVHAHAAASGCLADGRRFHTWRVVTFDATSGRKMVRCRHCPAERWETRHPGTSPRRSVRGGRG